MRFTRIFCGVLQLLLGSGVACGGDEAPPDALCVPGETRLCNGPGGCDGAQFCLSDGMALSECDCGASTTAEAPPDYTDCANEGSCNLPNRLAARCETDADCGDGLLCWAAASRDFFGFEGGPAGGYCTLDCSLPDDCQHLDPGAACNVVDGRDRGICLRGCLSKEPQPMERKCLDRSDVACWSLPALNLQAFSTVARQQGNCQPACGSDEECGERYCDLATGLCTDEPRLGAAIGAACDVDSDCASGRCLSLIDGGSFCSAACVFGALGCGFGEDAVTRAAVCAAPLLAEGGVSEGAGDVGTCLEVCNLTDPCTLPEWQCALGIGLPGGSGVCQFVGAGGSL